VIEAPGSVGLKFRPHFWNSALGVELQAQLGEWSDRGWIADPQGTEEAPDSFEITPRALEQTALGKQALQSTEEIADAVNHRDLLTRLLGLPAASALVSSDSYVGSPTLRFRVAVRLGLESRSSLLDVNTTTDTVPPDLHQLLTVVDQWNARASSSRLDQLLFLGELKTSAQRAARYTGGLTVTFDQHLADFELVRVQSLIPRWSQLPGTRPAFGIEVDITHAGGREHIDLGQLDQDALLADGGGKRSLVFENNHAEFLRGVRAKWLNRSLKAAAPAMADPARLLPAGVGSEGIDFSEYSARVLGFKIAQGSRGSDISSSGRPWFADSQLPSPFLVVTLPSVDDGAPRTELAFQSPEQAEDALVRLRREHEKSDGGAVQIGDTLVIPTRALIEQLATILETYRKARTIPAPDDAATTAPKPSQRLGVVVEEGKAGKDAETRSDVLDETALLNMLQPGIQLKDHQLRGIQWMWRQFKEGAQGVLLADEMGLGKTLQVACFLTMQRALPGLERRPALIVAPLLLLENWQEEMGRFLRPEAHGPLFVLHGPGLTQVKEAGGQLDLAALGEKSLVVTNYDTLDRYQQSLLKMDWRAVVLDEAQNIKNPDALRSRAARGLKRDFGICVTGTPVENKLSDLWTLFDFLSPGDPLTTHTDFRARFSAKDAEAPRRLARVLDYPGERSKVMRREKTEVLDLPKKEYVLHLTEMSTEQMQQERHIVSRRGDGSERSIFEKLNGLRALYQHPWLLRDRLFGSDDASSVPDLEAIVEASPKLKLCLEILERVERDGEKALVFTPWTKMQTVLIQALRERFGLRRLRVVNGEANQRGMATTYIREFSGTPGFHVLVLSPLAAGAGLNIVAANHVIHYGRWWNPAKEDQATDRAHRIGQTRPVTVHLPVLCHKGTKTEGFDVKLHELVERKRKVAREFLNPGADVTAEDYAEVFATQGVST
jgi:hypothetical protein